MSTATPPDPATCPSCGEARPADPVTAGADQPTHCEWCGAEYPLPGEGDS